MSHNVTILVHFQELDNCSWSGPYGRKASFHNLFVKSSILYMFLIISWLFIYFLFLFLISYLFLMYLSIWYVLFYSWICSWLFLLVIHMDIHIQGYIHIYIWIHIWIYIYKDIHVYGYIYVDIHLWIHGHIWIYIYLWIYIYMETYAKFNELIMYSKIGISLKNTLFFSAMYQPFQRSPSSSPVYKQFFCFLLVFLYVKQKNNNVILERNSQTFLIVSVALMNLL